MSKIPKIGGRVSVQFETGQPLQLRSAEQNTTVQSYVGVVQAIHPPSPSNSSCLCKIDVMYPADGEKESCQWPDPEITLLDYRRVDLSTFVFVEEALAVVESFEKPSLSSYSIAPPIREPIPTQAPKRTPIPTPKQNPIQYSAVPRAPPTPPQIKSLTISRPLLTIPFGLSFVLNELGLFIGAVSPTSPAAPIISAGDIILTINGVDVRSYDYNLQVVVSLLTSTLSFSAAVLRHPEIAKASTKAFENFVFESSKPAPPEQKKRGRPPKEANGGEGKRKSCGECSGCRAGNCGLCKYCLDMPRFGGLGSMRQKCAVRACIGVGYEEEEKAGATPQTQSQTQELSNSATHAAANAAVSCLQNVLHYFPKNNWTINNSNENGNGNENEIILAVKNPRYDAFYFENQDEDEDGEEEEEDEDEDDDEEEVESSGASFSSNSTQLNDFFYKESELPPPSSFTSWLSAKKIEWLPTFSWRKQRRIDLENIYEDSSNVMFPSGSSDGDEQALFQKWLSVRKNMWRIERRRKQLLSKKPTVGEIICIKCPAIPPHPPGWYKANVKSVYVRKEGGGTFNVHVVWDGSGGEVEMLVDPEWRKIDQTDGKPKVGATVCINCAAAPPFPAGWYKAVVNRVETIAKNQLGMYQVHVVWEGSSVGEVETIIDPEWREVSPTETNEITYLSDDEKNIQTRSQTKPLDGQFAKGDLIKARYKGRSKWYTGKIDAVVNSTGMLYNVRYDDGDLEKNVKKKDIRLLVPSSQIWQETEAIIDKAQNINNISGHIDTAMTDIEFDNHSTSTTNTPTIDNATLLCEYKMFDEIIKLKETKAQEELELKKREKNEKKVYDISWLFDPMKGAPDDMIIEILGFLPPQHLYTLLSVDRATSHQIRSRDHVWHVLFLKKKLTDNWIVPKRMRKSWCFLFLKKLKEEADRRFVESNEVLNVAANLIKKGDNVGQLQKLIKEAEEKMAFNINYTSGVIMERNSLLNLAVIAGRIKIVKWLVVEKKAFIETRDRGNFTPLLNAGYNGHVAMCKFLMGVGCRRSMLGLNHSSRPMLYKTAEYKGLTAEGWARKRGFGSCADVIKWGIE